MPDFISSHLRPWGTAPLRTQLVRLVLLAFVPVVAFAAALVVVVHHNERAAFERGLTETARALAIAVDRDLNGSISTAEALATAPTLDHGELVAFQANARRVLQTELRHGWLTIVVAEPGGRRVMDILHPPGAPLPPDPEPESVEACARTAQPTVTNLVIDPLTGQPSVGVRVPVMSGHRVRYVLTALISSASVGKLLSAQRVPTSWVGAVLDRRGTLLARTMEPERFVGRPGSATLRAAAEQAPEGAIHAASVEGRPLYTGFSHVPLTGWTVAIGAPAEAVEASLGRSLLLLGGGGLLLAALALGTALAAGRRIAHAIGSLAAGAEALGHGGVPPLTQHSAVAEVEAAANALDRASRLLEERSAERDRAEAGNAWLAAIVQSSDDAIMGKTLEGVITSWNAGAEKVLGYRPEEIVGQSVMILVPTDHHDEETGLLRRLSAGEYIQNFETVRIRKDGRVLPVSVTISPVRDRRERIIGASTIARDITDLKRVEEERAALLAREQAARAEAEAAHTEAEQRRREAEVIADLAATINASLDLDVILERVAEGAKELCASDGAAILLREDPSSDVFVPRHRVGDRPRAYESLRVCPGCGVGGRVLATGRPFSTADYAADPRITKDYVEAVRAEGIVALMVAPIRIGKGIEGLLYVDNRSPRAFGDREEAIVTRLAEHAAIAVHNVQLLQDEQAARAEAEAAGRARDEFLATLSHELRTPLNAIYGWARMLRSGHLDETAKRRAVEVIERSASTQTQLIEDLLDVSRIITGKMRLDVRPVELAPVVEAALDVIQPAAEAKALTLDAALDTRAGRVSGDPERLQQVVWNLLSNAVKFTPRQGRIAVALRGADSHVEIVVSDTGKGIEPSVLPYVFDRFRQADSSSTRGFSGLGIGLALVRHLVELHGGTVAAESAGEGKGATFTVTLPIAAPHARPDEGERHLTARAEERVPLAPSLDGMRVLVVDDDRDALDLLEAMLRARGATTRGATSAAEGLDALVAWRPDVLVSDIEMPERDGYALIRSVRALPAEQGGRTPAVAVTAYGRTGDRVRALAAGFNMHLPKPVEPAELATVIASVAGRT